MKWEKEDRIADEKENMAWKGDLKHYVNEWLFACWGGS